MLSIALGCGVGLPSQTHSGAPPAHAPAEHPPALGAEGESTKKVSSSPGAVQNEDLAKMGGL
jgi:hypothetical protein